MTVGPAPPSRILVYGVCGSGKSALARQLAERLDLPLYPVDDLTWEPGWVQVPKPLQRQRIAAICDRDAWVLDAAYGNWMDVPLGSVDLIVCLDFPRWVSLSRLLRRTAGRLLARTPVCNGNRESFRMLLSKESIFRWHFTSFGRKRQRMRQWHSDPGGIQVLLFRSPRAVTRWLRAVPPANPAAGPGTQWGGSHR
ncbi:adenylate kinase [Plantactinospora solaniradicis]|uniref:Adenylate kinase n=1 Tax=Plantactinospora solaniradicis TaxID=1723736 RepID=A0ABW1KH96_9ACTN